jgi:hypothetical protein
MLEAPILDDVEQLLGATAAFPGGIPGNYVTKVFPTEVICHQPDYFAGIGSWVKDLETSAGNSYRPVGWWSPSLNAILFGMAGTSSANFEIDMSDLTRAVPTNQGIGIMSAGFTGKGLTMFYEDNTSVIWAIANQSGFYGLYKRTGIDTWTQVLSDTGASGTIAMWPNTGVVYYINSAATNFYSLANGVATVSVNPSGNTDWANNWYCNIGSFNVIETCEVPIGGGTAASQYGVNTWKAFGNGINVPPVPNCKPRVLPATITTANTEFDATANYPTRYPRLWPRNSYSANTNPPVPVVPQFPWDPFEQMMRAGNGMTTFSSTTFGWPQAVDGTIGNSVFPQIYYLNATYSLLVLNYTQNTALHLMRPEEHPRQFVMFIFNRTTGFIRYIGRRRLACQSTQSSVTTDVVAQVSKASILAANYSNGLLTLVWAQVTGYDYNTPNYAGGIFQQRFQLNLDI